MENYKQQRTRNYNRKPLPRLKIAITILIAVLNSLKEMFLRKIRKYTLQFIKGA